MKDLQITCDTEVPAPSTDSNLFNRCVDTDSPYRDYSLPRGDMTGFEQGSLAYSKPSGSKHYSVTRNYDVPKDTLNSDVLKSGSHGMLSGSPTKQPLLHGPAQKHSVSHKSALRSPPPTIVLSPPEETSPERAEVIFEYDNEKYTEQPNFLIRYKRLILTVTIISLMLLLLTFVVMMIYAAHHRKL
ncbi:unnamed protein product [Thelazia callipaeda]|uniref:LEM domain-containing protein n=1 Tax=Thelazia callipaeda TaxID=103827 RepID=A0A0N5CML9_THECL|nr:unnamed protein product [Thelazia callipaeda]